MKGVISLRLLLLLLSLLFSQPFSAPLLPTLSLSLSPSPSLQQQQQDDSFVNIQEHDDMAAKQLFGMEECHENDEACLSRRMLAEAHLDYIYTQPHKPKGLP